MDRIIAYRTLEITVGAGDAEIKKAYRRLARRYHPDHNHGNKAAEEKFKEIQQAHQFLAKPQPPSSSRSQYRASETYSSGDPMVIRTFELIGTPWVINNIADNIGKLSKIYPMNFRCEPIDIRVAKITLEGRESHTQAAMDYVEQALAVVREKQEAQERFWGPPRRASRPQNKPRPQPAAPRRRNLSPLKWMLPLILMILIFLPTLAHPAMLIPDAVFIIILGIMAVLFRFRLDEHGLKIHRRR